VRGREKLLGPDHADTLTSVSNLAGILEAQGVYSRSLDRPERDRSRGGHDERGAKVMKKSKSRSSAMPQTRTETKSSNSDIMAQLNTRLSSMTGEPAQQQQEGTSSRAESGGDIKHVVIVVESDDGRDLTQLPNTLNEKFDKLDKEGAVRPVVLSLVKDWKKRSQKALLASPEVSYIGAEKQLAEKTAAFDLLDALSRSGGFTLEQAELHVVLVSAHCFDKTLMDTVIQKNVNPIEKMEQSALVMAAVVHGTDVEELVRVQQVDRLLTQAPALFEKEGS